MKYEEFEANNNGKYIKSSCDIKKIFIDDC